MLSETRDNTIIEARQTISIMQCQKFMNVHANAILHAVVYITHHLFSLCVVYLIDK